MLLEKISAIENRYNEINRLLEEFANDYQRVAELAKERSDMEQIVTKAQEYRKLSTQLDEDRALIDSGEVELRELAEADIQSIEPKIEILEKELKMLLIPKDPRDDRNVIVEIRAGTGGDEAALFAADLMRMYTRYAELKKWSIEVLSENPTGIGGYKEIVFSVKGRGAYSRLKFESGVHRVQRIPSTESSGRIHTSTATVAVLAEADEVDIQIPDKDINIDVYRSAGAGGQNVQKNSTAVRITHLPTGIVVACQDERSQLQNKLRAMTILRARLYEIEETKRSHEREDFRRSQIGNAERSEKIRTYNYPQSRVTDHRVNISSFNLPSVMEGDIDLFIDELSLQEETDRLSTSSESDDAD
ncbi:MAG TPA: peptide chain release factor 1 [Longilinea sp.]|nr:peptide chain release factor 1 [Longilinea sp.]